jgi:hypothetical protein
MDQGWLNHHLGAHRRPRTTCTTTGVGVLPTPVTRPLPRASRPFASLAGDNSNVLGGVAIWPEGTVVIPGPSETWVEAGS